MKTVSFRVPNMHCSGCALTLEGLEDEVDGIRSVKASYRQQTMEVTFDESRVTPAHIIAAAKEHGYDAVAIQ